MKKETIGFITCVSIILVLASICVYFSFKDSGSTEFYGTVKEVYNGHALVEVLDENATNIGSDVVDIDKDNFKVGDIIKVEVDKDMQETYPPAAKVKKITIIKESTSTSMVTTEITTKEIVTEMPITSVKTTTTIRYERPTETTKVYVQSTDSVMKNLEDNYALIEENKNDVSFGEKAKNYFITIVDFIFYDRPINGVYFKNLTASAKLKVIGLALKVDGIIEKYYPSYKEDFSESYENAKSKLIELYLDSTAKYCENNEQVCNQAKADFQDLKKSLNITWDIIKDLTNSGISKLKKWYEIYSGK